MRIVASGSGCNVQIHCPTEESRIPGKTQMHAHIYDLRRCCYTFDGLVMIACALLIEQ